MLLKECGEILEQFLAAPTHHRRARTANMSTSEASDEDENLVEAWTTTHSDPKFQTDLWFIVTENGVVLHLFSPTSTLK